MTEFTTWRSLVDGNEIVAIPDGVVDNFEDADADPPGVYEDGETIADYYGGDTGQFSRTTDEVETGVKSLDINVSSNSLIISTSGLNSYPEKGDIFEVYGYHDGDGVILIYFGAPNEAGWGDDSGYRMYTRNDDNRMRIERSDNGSITTLAEDDNASIPSNEWLRFRCEWHDGTGAESDNEIVFELYDESGTEISKLSVNDDSYADDTGIGFGSFNSNEQFYVDEFHVIGHVSD